MTNAQQREQGEPILNKIIVKLVDCKSIDDILDKMEDVKNSKKEK